MVQRTKRRVPASARPVVTQDTGFGAVLPTGKGLLSFGTVEEAVDCVGQVEDDYRSHCDAARSIAEDYFDSATVLSALLERAMAVDLE